MSIHIHLKTKVFISKNECNMEKYVFVGDEYGAVIVSNL